MSCNGNVTVVRTFGEKIDIVSTLIIGKETDVLEVGGEFVLIGRGEQLNAFVSGEEISNRGDCGAFCIAIVNLG